MRAQCSFLYQRPDQLNITKMEMRFRLGGVRAWGDSSQVAVTTCMAGSWAHAHSAPGQPGLRGILLCPPLLVETGVP